MLPPGLIFSVFVCGIILCLLSRRGRKAVITDVLSTVLMWWTPNDPLTAYDLLDGGILIIGRTGSGKSSGSGKAIARAITRYPRSGGLIPASKPEDCAFWKHTFKEAGRLDDLIIFEPGGPYRFNFLDHLASIQADARTITKYLLMLAESVASSTAQGGGEDSQFFGQQNERYIYDAVVVIKLGNGKVSAPALYEFITTAATSTLQLSSKEWRKGFHNQCMKAAFCNNGKSAIEAGDYKLATQDWFIHWPEMADKTRSSIAAGIMGILHVANTGMVRDLVSGETNCSPLDMLAGKFILVNTPPTRYGPAGAFINAGWRLLTQFTVLQREVKSDDFINVIFNDEFQQTCNSFDADYLALCRSHRGCMICLTQSLHSIYGAMKGDTGHHRADALITNFRHKVFHAVGDVETAEYASGLIGKSLQTFVGGSMAPEENIFSSIVGHSQVSGSFSQHYEAILQPNVFMNGLRTGGVRNRCISDAIVVRSGEAFASGANWSKVAFSQR